MLLDMAGMVSRKIINLVKSIVLWGKDTLWKQCVIYTCNTLLALSLLSGGMSLWTYYYEHHTDVSIKEHQHFISKNKLLLLKDVLELCIDSISTNHKYQERYCTNALQHFEQQYDSSDPYIKEQVNLLVYEEMVINVNHDIRYLGDVSLVKNISIYKAVPEHLFAIAILIILLILTFCFLLWPFLFFWKLKIKEQVNVE
ncbi:hypothetical protein HWQ46_26950 [Shewanella sp. D64]|uniref:hypothetical protein n=1 Tax=unclassified Shewanella TaxID=196818 RepID=UPI0022BA457A|nr:MULTISPECIES: hypothetical protein [unclassified Shewanella]MEC4729143.1 hypothetical protein [Shewanella sp. D64]MEC4740931.1 hypothetical protein [Shewanella sp. E94]WBJ95712.1 hypothetical protein HWQ47_00815 [Shewanella sp. MTB7]